MSKHISFIFIHKQDLFSSEILQMRKVEHNWLLEPINRHSLTIATK